MRVYQIIPYSYSIHAGGLEKIAQTIADGLTSGGISCCTVASNIETGGGKTLGKTCLLGGETHHDRCEILLPSTEIVSGFPVPKLWTKRFWCVMNAIVNDREPSTILTHTRFFISSLIGGIVAKISRKKWIHVEHGSGFVQGYPWVIRLCSRFFDWTIGLRIFRQCDLIITISNEHKAFIRRFTKKDPVVIYNPIEYEPYAKVDNEIPHIGFVGRLVPLKGVDVLIDALAHLKDISWICTIVGDGPERTHLEEQVKRLSLQDRVLFVGVDDRKNWLHKFDVFVNPSYQEGLPTTVVEALLARCIVVATNVGGTKEISDKQDFLLVPPGDSLQLQNGIVQGLSRLSFAGASQTLVKEKFAKGTSISHYKHCIVGR